MLLHPHLAAETRGEVEELRSDHVLLHGHFGSVIRTFVELVGDRRATASEEEPASSTMFV